MQRQRKEDLMNNSRSMDFFGGIYMLSVVGVLLGLWRILSNQEKLHALLSKEHGREKEVGENI